MPYAKIYLKNLTNSSFCKLYIRNYELKITCINCIVFILCRFVYNLMRREMMVLDNWLLLTINISLFMKTEEG